MKTLLFFFSFLHLLGFSSTVYKQWIPNTNFENASNWDQGRIPCANDVVRFQSSEVVSVFVKSSHSITDMYIPLNGEFLLAPGAGFEAFDCSYDSGCKTGSEITFGSAQKYQWQDPRLWHVATSMENLEQGHYVFSVDEERVPCQYDDVIFQPETSFRVNLESSEETIQLRSISVMGQRFTSDDTLAQYMKSHSAKLQFHGPGAFRLSNTRCPDRSGCECGNSADYHRICAALLQDSGNECPTPLCKNPLKPVGQCCEICGATISLEYSSGFDIELYRDRMHHTFLSLPKNAGIQMAVSKVREPHTSPGVIPRSSVSLIQIVLIDNKTGSQVGVHAEQLAKDIMNDIAEHGESFGIVRGNLQTTSGTNWDTQRAVGPTGTTVAGIAVGLILILLLLGIALLLYRKRTSRLLLAMRFPSCWHQQKDLDAVGEAADKGFHNPMFDTPSNLAAFEGACTMEETPKATASRTSGIYCVNPLYDETELS